MVDLRPEVRVDLLADDMVDAMMVERRAACSFIPTMKKVTMTPLPSEPHLRTLEEGAGLAIYQYVMQQHVIMSSDEIESGNNDDNESTTSTFSTQRVMESVMRILSTASGTSRLDSSHELGICVCWILYLD